MKIILVTGGTGLVGTGIQYVLEAKDDEQWIFVGSKDADLTDLHQVIALFNKHKPTHVIHLASVVGGIYKNASRNLDFFRLNNLMNDNVLKCANDFNVKKVLSCLSTTVFSPDSTTPFDENSCVTGSIDKTHEGYIWSKRMNLVLNRLYNQGSNDRLFTSFIPCNIFGPGDNFNPQECHFVPAIIRRMHDAKHDNKPLIVSGDSKPLRQFIYSRDLAKIIVWLLRNYDDPEPVVVSPGADDEVPISTIVEKIAQCYNFTNEIIYDNRTMGGEQKRTVSNDKLIGVMGDFKFTSLGCALDETVRWFVHNLV